MDIHDILRSQGGIGAIASQFGISETQAQQGAAALLPSILSGFGQRTEATDYLEWGVWEARVELGPWRSAWLDPWRPTLTFGP